MLKYSVKPTVSRYCTVLQIHRAARQAQDVKLKKREELPVH